MDKTKPKVLIMIAASVVSGPAKGLFQTLKYAQSDRFDYLLCNFSIKGEEEDDFIIEAKRLGLNLVLLRQNHFYDPTLILQTKNLIETHGFNILQTHGHKSNFIARFVKKSIQIPWLCFVHGWTDEDLKIRVYNMIDRWTIKGADRIVTVSEAMRNKLTAIGISSQKISVIYNAIEVDGTNNALPNLDLKRNYAFNDKTLLVGVIGRMSREKGQRYFLEAWEKVCKEVPNTKAILIGDGPDRKILEKICISKRIQERVLFIGYQNDLHPLYRIIDLVVMPSLSEGLPNVLLESLAHGIPVVATSVGGIPEVIGNGSGGILVTPNDHITMARTIKKVLEDESLRKTLSISGKDIILKGFSVDSRNIKILQLYNSLITKETH